MLVKATSYQGNRSNQEDAYAVLQLLNALWIIVADGMGGHPEGEVASKAAVHGVLRRLTSSRNCAMLNLFRAAHLEVLKQTAEGCTTLTIACISGGMLTIGYAGDSPAILIRDGDIHYRTRAHGYGNRVSKWLGAKSNDDWEPEEACYSISTGDIVIVGSDGILPALENPLDVYDIADIAEEAILQGSQDNCTGVMVRV